MSSQFLSIMVKDSYGLVVAYCLIIKQLNRPTFDGMVKIFHGIKIKILNAPDFIITASRTSDAFTQFQSHEVHSIHAQPAMGRLSHRPPPIINDDHNNHREWRYEERALLILLSCLCHVINTLFTSFLCLQNCLKYEANSFEVRDHIMLLQ